jgi:hypothetical protein
MLAKTEEYEDLVAIKKMRISNPHLKDADVGEYIQKGHVHHKSCTELCCGG